MRATVFVLVCVLGSPWAVGEVVTYSAPDGEELSAEYRVWADGKSVDVYMTRGADPAFVRGQRDYGGPCGFASFDVDGPVEVRVTSATRSLRDVVIRPASAGAQMKLPDDRTLIVSLPGPRKISIEPDGKRGPLLLFANPIEKDVPKPDAQRVIYFGPGVHKPGRIDLKSGQTLYLAGGAVVKGGVAVEGSHVRICGRGILDGNDWPHGKGPTPNMIGIRGTDVELSGITIRGSSRWTVVLRGSRRVTVRNLKICNSRVQNDDGINPCNSQDVRITDCFIRSDDDCIAMKGMDFSAANSNVERVTVENCILWSDRARIFLLGHESRAQRMGDITLRNLDVVHYSMTPFLLEPGEEMLLENVTIEDVRLHGEGQRDLIRLRPVVNMYMRKKVPGSIRNVRFRNVVVTGSPGSYRVEIDGPDPQHNVRGVSFDALTILGSPLTAQSPQLQVGENAESIRFGPQPE